MDAMYTVDAAIFLYPLLRLGKAWKRNCPCLRSEALQLGIGALSGA